MREKKSKCYDEGTFDVHYMHGGEVWDVHGCQDEGVVTPTIPEDVVGHCYGTTCTLATCYFLLLKLGYYHCSL